MKTVNTLAIAAVLSSLSFASFAAVEVQSTPAGQHKVGTISASAGTNLGSLEDQLAQKADEMGATSYRITSVTGRIPFTVPPLSTSKPDASLPGPLHRTAMSKTLLYPCLTLPTKPAIRRVFCFMQRKTTATAVRAQHDG